MDEVWFDKMMELLSDKKNDIANIKFREAVFAYIYNLQTTIEDIEKYISKLEFENYLNEKD